MLAIHTNQTQKVFRWVYYSLWKLCIAAGL